MIPLTFLCDGYIDRPKLTEQKNPLEYIVPPPTSGVGTIITEIKRHRRNIPLRIGQSKLKYSSESLIHSVDIERV